MVYREKHVYISPAQPHDAAYDIVGRLINAFIDARTAAKGRADTAANSLRTDLATINGDGLPNKYQRVQARLLQFEQAYLQERTDWQGVVTPVNANIVGTLNPAGDQVALTYQGHDAGTIYLNDARFVPDAQVKGVQTYVSRSGNPRQYVRAANNVGRESYVPRYVLRGLNLADLWAYEGDGHLRSAHDTNANCVANEHDPAKNGRHPAPNIGQALSKEQQIISHTRGWRKRLISAVPSQREIYSTRGVPFDGNTGVAKIDLVEVLANGGVIRDVHSIPYANNIYGYTPADIVGAANWQQPNLGVATGTYDSEKFKGYRDVLRTREILIDGTIPFAAIGATPTGRFVVSAAVDTYQHAQAVEQAITGRNIPGMAAQVTMNYSLYGNYHSYSVINNEHDAWALYDWLEDANNPNHGWIRYGLLMRQLTPA